MGLAVQYEVGPDGLKAWINAITTINKIGKELVLEATSTSLICRTLNDSHSASGEFVFPTKNGVFNSTSFPRGVKSLQCKVFIKTICSAFRTARNATALTIIFECDDVDDDGSEIINEYQEPNVIVFKLQFDQGITKTHRLGSGACQVMRAVFERSGAPNRMSTSAFHWNKMLEHMHNTNEIKIVATKEKFRLESYFSNAEDERTQLQTVTEVDVVEFNDYCVASDDSEIELIFGLKELKAMLKFCEAADLDEVFMYFSIAGSPVLISTECSRATTFTANLTLSTLQQFLNDPSQASNNSTSQSDAKFNVRNDYNKENANSSPTPQSDSD